MTATLKPPVDWELIEREYRAGRGHFPLGENGAVRVIKQMLSVGAFEKACGIPPAIHIEHEFPLPKGRADFVIFHADGTATIVEVKDGGALRDILAGIGQLMSYGVQLGYSRTLTAIRRLLVAAIPGEGSIGVDEACRAAGIKFIPLGTVWEHEAIWAQAAAEVDERRAATEPLLSAAE